MKSQQAGSFSLVSIGISVGILLAIFGIFRPTGENAFVVIFIHGTVLVAVLGANLFPVGLILLVAFLLRLFFLYIDLKTDMYVFSSGQDTENFYEVALAVFKDPTLFTVEMYGGIFPKVVGALFLLVGPSRELLQYLNILLGIASLILVVMSGKKLDCAPKNIQIVLFVCAVMPISASISAIFLRESLITFFVALSVFYFCCWLKNGKARFAVGALCSLSFGGAFHLGVFGIIFGYVVAFFIFDYASGKFIWSSRRLFSMLPILGAFVFFISSFSDLFLEKLETVSSASDVLARASTSRGGSAYLPGIEIDSPIDFVLFGGVKALLLLVSPPPWVWRSFADIVSFVFDGFIFLVALIVIFQAFRRMKSSPKKRILGMLVLCLVSVLLVIGAGTGNSGTAMRHRQKVVPLVAVSVMVAMPARRNEHEVNSKVSRHDSLAADITSSTA